MKEAALLPDVQLQPHQEKLYAEAKQHSVRKLLLWQLGSGKSLGALAAAEAGGGPYTTVVPASLRPNIQKEKEKFTTGDTPSDVLSYSEVARGKPVDKLDTLIADEAQRLRNPGSKQTQHMMDLADRAKQLLLLSGTPMTNRPGDLAPLVSMLTKQQISPADFEKRYLGTKQVGPGFIGRLLGGESVEEPAVQHANELKAMLQGHVDYYQPSKSVVPVSHEEHISEMGVNQSRLYKAFWDQLPWVLKWKMRRGYPLSNEELRKARSFLVGPRQVGLSTYPFQKKQDPYAAFQESSKLQQAFGLMQEKLKDERAKGLVFSNFVDAGLTPYAAALQKANIPHAMFHGGLNDVERKRLVEDYNTNKIRVALLGPSGTEGLSFKGTQLLQVLDPHFNPSRGQQSEGRALRFDSHTDLPEDLKNVTVQRFIAHLPMGFKDKLLSRLGFNRKVNQRASDDYLRDMIERKRTANQKFMDLLKEVGTRKQSAEVPAVEQQLNSSCGPAALKAVFESFGYGTKTEKTLRQETNSSADKGTLPTALAEVAYKNGLTVESFGEMDLYQLSKVTSEGKPVIVCMQSTMDPPDGWDNGHYIVVKRLVDDKVYYMDPAVGEERFLSHNQFLRRWHDKDGNGKKYVHFGLVLKGPGKTKEAASPTLELLQKAKQHSDRKEWQPKHVIIRNLMDKSPGDWHVDSDDGRIVGVTHKSGFQFHMPKHTVPLHIKRAK